MQFECSEAQSLLIEPIKEYLKLPQLWVCTSALGASQLPDHRRDLRRSIVDYLTHKIKNRELPEVVDLSKGLGELVALTDLSKRPETSFAKFSISHCPDLGGFAIAPGASSIGFDMEISQRITNDIMLRMSDPDELFDAPNAAALWVAKESAFKALPPAIQPLVISQLRISAWELINERTHGFRFELKQHERIDRGIGAVAHTQRLKLGFSVFLA